MNQISSITDSPSPPSPSVPTLLEADAEKMRLCLELIATQAVEQTGEYVAFARWAQGAARDAINATQPVDSPTLLEAAERILGSSSSGVPVDVPDMPGVKCYLVSIVGMQALAEAVSRERKAVGK